MSTSPLLSVEDLKVQFFTESGTVRAVDGITFEIEEGETVGLVGESGAGKSVASMSLLRLVESPGEIVSGNITYKGEMIFGVKESADGTFHKHDDMLSETEMRRRIRGKEIAFIFQDPMESLNPVYTIGGQLREFIELNRDMSKDDAKAEAIQMLREVGIPDPEERYEEYPHQFSGGMRQRVLIAMALACEPSLIIADEPTTALDVTVERQILELVSDLQERYGTSFLWVTHDMGVVAEICDRVNVMYLGEIVEQAPVDEIFYETKHPYTDALLRSMPRPDQTTDLEPIKGSMANAMNPPSGCRFHPRCPDAREVCTRNHPDTIAVDRADGYPHRAACVKHDAFDVNYTESKKLEHVLEGETSEKGESTAINDGRKSRTDGGAGGK